MRVLILCTGNSARSQMAEGFLRSLDSALDVSSAGTQPAERVHPAAIAVMQEIGIDISGAVPKGVEGFLNAPFDFVITVCDDANETCPLFAGKVGKRIHMGFDDPAKARGSDEEVLAEFRRVRDQIRERFEEMYRTRIMPASRR